MTNFFTLLSLFVIILKLVTAHDPIRQEVDVNAKTAHISPELLNELKDFENLIPTATVDEIVAKHYLMDGSFRKTLQYLRSEEFTQLEKQLWDVPEIIDVLKFLHLIEQNGTMLQMSATVEPKKGKQFVVASLDEYVIDGATDSNKETNNNYGILTKPQTLLVDDNDKEEATSSVKVPKRPQTMFYVKARSNNKNYGLDAHNIDNDDDDDETVNANSIAFSEQQPLVHIVLLEDSEVKAKISNKGQPQQLNHQHKYKHQRSNSYQHHISLGTFTSFVEEVLEHLPNAAYRQMITDKCQNNSKFAQFYRALRNPVFKPYIQELKTKPNIQTLIATLNSHGVDVNALEAIAFKVISWGPNI